VLKVVETQRIIPKKFFRIIEGSDGIYEVRVEIESNIYRIFCCMDGGAVVFLFHGFQKKTQKTPMKEIKRAEAIKKEYFKSKEMK
jgi:phage-related protein